MLNGDRGIKTGVVILVLRSQRGSSVSCCCTRVMLLGILNSFLTHEGYRQYWIILSEL